MPRYYAYAPALDPASGDWVPGSGRPAGPPAREAVVLVLRTHRGSYAPDPTFGVDYGLIQKATPNVPALWQAEVTRALRPLVASGLITDLKVTADAPRAGRLFYSVDFRDPRSDERLEPLRLVA